MKQRILFILVACAAILWLNACDKYFDINTRDQATLEDVMSRSTAVRQYLAHLYAYIPNDENLRGNEGGTSLRSDEALHGKSQWETNWYKVRRGEYSSASAKDVSTGNYWKKFYEAINECTIFIDNLHYDKEDSEKLVRCMEGEARFLRAYYYFCLFRHYGPVFLWKDGEGNPVASDQSIMGEDIDRNTVEENVNFMVKELDRAIELLPVSIGDVISAYSNAGRATKGAAMALKTRLLLYAASPLYNGQNGTGMYDGFVNSKGQALFPEYDATKWTKVHDAALELINLGAYELTPSPPSRMRPIPTRTSGSRTGAPTRRLSGAGGTASGPRITWAPSAARLPSRPLQADVCAATASRSLPLRSSSSTPIPWLAIYRKCAY